MMSDHCGIMAQTAGLTTLVAPTRPRGDADRAIWPNDTPDLYGEPWLGKAWTMGDKETPPFTRTMIGVAGAVAEYLFDRDDDDYFREPDFWDDPYIMSDTDWRMTGYDPHGDEYVDARFMRAARRVGNQPRAPTKR